MKVNTIFTASMRLMQENSGRLIHMLMKALPLAIARRFMQET